ncbi:hypothetical protein OG582_39375 (plasmid) [Streptomyces anulatus]|uniref:hypothetical protein n=1 Tax=Streptomyces TaxID=1883 RepID=UPI00178C720B|nr:hypothetical protein [Streptomyces sp. W007]
MTRTTPALAGGVCPTCELIMEACTCTGVTQLLTVLAPHAGVADEIGRQDDRGGHDGRGYERDETDQFHQVVRRLTDDGDRRARAAGRRTRRTFAEMAPGQARQPVLHMTRPLTFAPTASRASADDACTWCGRWLCGGNCFAPAPVPSLRAVASS